MLIHYGKRNKKITNLEKHGIDGLVGDWDEKNSDKNVAQKTNQRYNQVAVHTRVCTVLNHLKVFQ